MGVGVHGQPGQDVVAFEYEPQYVGRHVRIQRMFRRRLGLHHRVVIVLQDLEAVQVQRYPQEHRADVLQVRAGRPEPRGHSAGRRR